MPARTAYAAENFHYENKFSPRKFSSGLTPTLPPYEFSGVPNPGWLCLDLSGDSTSNQLDQLESNRECYQPHVCN